MKISTKLLFIGILCFSHHINSMEFLKTLWGKITVIGQYIPGLKNSSGAPSKDSNLHAQASTTNYEAPLVSPKKSGSPTFSWSIFNYVSSLFSYVRWKEIFTYSDQRDEKKQASSDMSIKEVKKLGQKGDEVIQNTPPDSHNKNQKSHVGEHDDKNFFVGPSNLKDINQHASSADHTKSLESIDVGCKDSDFSSDCNQDKNSQTISDLLKAAEQNDNASPCNEHDGNNLSANSDESPNFEQLVKNSQTIPDLPTLAIQGDEKLYFEYKSPDGKSAGYAYAKQNFSFKESILQDIQNKSGITGEKFSDVCDKFIALHTDNVLTNQNNWIDSPYTQDDLNNPALVAPYVMGMRLPKNQKDQSVILFPDLHGDWKTVMKFLKDKFEKDCRIKHPQEKIFFLGDIVDRGLAGAEALYTLLLLRLKNPNNVFIIRGNHEDVSINDQYGFSWELRVKYGSEYYEQNLLSRIKKVYNMLPVMTLIIHDKKGFVGCHGCIDYRYNAQELVRQLRTGKDVCIRYQKYPLAREVHRANKNFSSLLPQEVYIPSVEKPNGIGFMWLDHCACRKTKKCLSYAKDICNLSDMGNDRCFMHKCQIDALLKDWSTDGVTLTDVYRAHQHSTSISKSTVFNRALMLSMFQGKGVCTVPCDQDNTTRCHTSLLAPNNTYGCANKKYPGFNYGTCIELTPDINDALRGFKVASINKQGFEVVPENINFIKNGEEIISTYVDENNEFYKPDNKIFNGNTKYITL